MGLGVSGAGAEGEEPLAVSGKRIIVWKSLRVTLIVALIVAVVAVVVVVVVVVVVIITTIIKLLAIIVAD